MAQMQIHFPCRICSEIQPNAIAVYAESTTCNPYKAKLQMLFLPISENQQSSLSITYLPMEYQSTLVLFLAKLIFQKTPLTTENEQGTKPIIASKRLYWRCIQEHIQWFR